MTLHKSDSSEQLSIERVIIPWLEKKYTLELSPPKYINLEDNSADKVKIQVDAIDEARTHAFEIYARIGALKAGNKKKISQDLLKLVFLKQYYPNIKLFMVLVDDSTIESLVGKSKVTWIAKAAEKLDIQIIKVELDADIRKDIIAAQKRQFR